MPRLGTCCSCGSSATRRARDGVASFLVFYLIVGIAPRWHHPPPFERIPSLGASGAISAVSGLHRPVPKQRVRVLVGRTVTQCPLWR